MATCNPNSLTAAATCFRCVPHREKRTLDLYLLNSAAGSFTIAQLAAGAAQYRPIQDKAALAAKCYALAVANAVTATAASLESLAKCWQCIPKAERENVEAYLNASNAGGSTDPKVLLRNIATYKGLYPVAEQVELYLLASLAMLTRAQMQAGAACLMCLSITRLQEIYLYLLCLGVYANLVPMGSVYSGVTPEFDLTVLPNTTYVVTWGVNEVSMTLCGTSIGNMGAGTQVIVNTGACTVMQFFGTFAGTSVTAMVRVVPVASQVPTPTGFTFIYSAPNAVATWDAPPAGVINTELWTSPDGLNYTLGSAVARPTATTSVTGPAAGALMYGKIRFTAKGFPTAGPFSSVISIMSHDTIVAAWAAQVVTNGGAAPTTATQNALDTFVGSLRSGNLLPKMVAINCFVNDSLIAAKTPLYKTAGVTPWTTVSGPGDAVGINGWFSNGTAWLDTGVDPTTAFADTKIGLTVYAFSFTGANIGYIGNWSDVTSQCCMLRAREREFFSMDTGGDTGSTVAPGGGYVSANRIATNDARVFFANSGNAHAQVGSYLVNNASAARAVTFSIACCKSDSGTPRFGSITQGVMSFAAIHIGLTQAESALLFAAVQAFRTTLGGGFV